MNLKELVWTNTKTTSEKLDIIDEEMNKIRPNVTNHRKMSLNIYYNFSEDTDKLRLNKKFQEYELAKEVIKIIKRWDKKYQIPLDKKVSGSIFSEFFKQSIHISNYNMYQIGINYRSHDSYRVKSLILWADKLVRIGVIGNVKYNMFLNHLENILNKPDEIML